MKKEHELQILQAANNLGVQISFDVWNIKPGDLYFAVKNTGVKLLTCKSNIGLWSKKGLTLMKYLVYPKGYDPMVASGPPSEWHIKKNIGWTVEDTKKQLELEKLVIIQDKKPPPEIWYIELGDNEPDFV